MRECESVRGQWSTPEQTNYCPDCGAVMPMDRGPLRSDHSMKNLDTDRSTNAATSASWDVFRWRPRVEKAA